MKLIVEVLFVEIKKYFNMKKAMLMMGVIVLTIYSCKRSEDSAIKDATDLALTELQVRAKAVFGELPDLVNHPEHEITDEKVFLGQSLYFDTLLSKNQTQSCNTCHNLDTYGVDNLPLSPGDAIGTLGNRNSPTTLNAALHFVQFWDGRASDVEEQAAGPILNPIEMGMPDEESALQRLRDSELYRDLFAKAFPDDQEPINWENLTKAIGAFERMLVTPTRFDKYIAGDDDALTNREKKGLEAFFNHGCIACHSGPALGGQTYQKFGVYGDYWVETKSENIDIGRAEVTENVDEQHFFKVPGLRNITKTYPYFHDGSVRDLKEAIRIMGKLQLNKEMSAEEIEDMAAFFDALTGEIDPKYAVNPHEN